jgi:hypothetical protein
LPWVSEINSSLFFIILSTINTTVLGALSTFCLFIATKISIEIIKIKATKIIKVNNWLSLKLLTSPGLTGPPNQ